MIVVEALVQQDGGDTRILVGEAVVILTPHVGGDEQVHGGDRLAPRDLADGSLEPLGVLVQHGVDHVHEGLIGAPDAVTAGEQVGLEEAFHLVLGELLSDLAGDSHVLVNLGGQVAGVPLLVGDVVSGLQTVGSGLVRSEDAEGVRVVLDDVASVDAQTTGGFELAPAVAVLGDFLDLVVFEAGRFSSSRITPPLAFGLAPMRSSPVGMKAVTSGFTAPFSSNSSSGL